jgi:hypothetical protein
VKFLLAVSRPVEWGGPVLSSAVEGCLKLAKAKPTGSDVEAKPPRDGRPYWSRYPTLRPSYKAARLGLRVHKQVLKLIQNRKELAQAETDNWLRWYLVYLADEYLRTQRWMALPSPEFYRKPVEEIQKAAEHLVHQIQQAPEEAVWTLIERTPRAIGMELRQKPPTRQSFETLLVKFIEACRTAANIEGRRGDRGRPDLVCAAVSMAKLWSRFSGKRFSKSVATTKKVPSTTRPGEFEFDAPGSQFIRELLPAFDPKISFAQVWTAIKAIPVKQLEAAESDFDQHLPEEEPETLDRCPVEVGRTRR